MVSYINFSNGFTKKEILTLNSLKEYFASQKVEYRIDIYNNDFLIRFLRSCNLNIKKTYQKLMNYFTFAKEYEIQKINAIKFPNIDKIKLFYPHGFHKVTKSGLPILLQDLGDLKIDDINRLLPDKLLTQYMISLLEKCLNDIFPKCSQLIEKKISELFCIVDLKGLTTSLMSKKVFDFVKTQLTICQNYYPGMIGGLYFINTGFIFRALWGACKYFYNDGTRNKIHLLSFSYKSQLLEKVNGVDLPIIFGGQCNCEPYGCMFSNAGPWNEIEIRKRNTVRSIAFSDLRELNENLNLKENRQSVSSNNTNILLGM